MGMDPVMEMEMTADGFDGQRDGMVVIVIGVSEGVSSAMEKTAISTMSTVTVMEMAMRNLSLQV